MHVDWADIVPRPGMGEAINEASTSHGVPANSFLDRWQRWIAASISVLLHVVIVLIILHVAKTTLAPPEGGGLGGARVQVEFINPPKQGEKRSATPDAGTTRAEKPQPPRPPKKVPPIQATQVAKADAPIPPKDNRREAPNPADTAGRQGRIQPPAGDPNATRRSTAPSGQAPGLLARETAPTNNGPDRGTTRGETRGPPAPGREPRMDVDGHQIYYDVRNEDWLLDWQAQGMKELYFPLPGRRELMVCPLEIVVRRGSGGCRLMQPGDPDLPNIGDARKVVHVVRVYRRGELVWKGPGAYR